MKKNLYFFWLCFVLLGCKAQNTDTEIVFSLQNRISGEEAKGIVIETAKTNCTELPLSPDEESKKIGIHKPSFPLSWCNITANNLPVVTDQDGKALLHFTLYPNPKDMQIKETELRAYNVPMIFWEIEKDSGISSARVDDLGNWHSDATIQK